MPHCPIAVEDAALSRPITRTDPLENELERRGEANDEDELPVRAWP